MKEKQFLGVILTLVLLFTAQPAAMAAANNGYATEIEADCRLPLIQVTVPSSNAVYINPFQLAVSIGEVDSTAQIISTPASIANKSEVPLAVNVTVTGTVNEGSDMTLASAPTGGTGTDKSAFVYFEIKQSNSSDLETVQWEPAYNAAKHIIVSSTSITRQNILTLPAKTLDDEVAEGGYALFRLTGDAVKNPASQWDSRDGINVTVAFTFTPLSYC